MDDTLRVSRSENRLDSLHFTFFDKRVAGRFPRVGEQGMLFAIAVDFGFGLFSCPVFG